MGLSSDILKDFANIVNKKTENSDDKKNVTSAYGTAVVTDGVKYVQLDGSDYLTPIAEATEAEDGDRVLIEIKDHRAFVIGNFTAPPSLRDSQAAQNTAGEALNKADEALQYAGEAEDLANAASDKAQSAIDSANEAKTKADEANNLSNDSMALTEAAEQHIEELRQEVNTVKSDSSALREEVREELKTVTDTMEADYAKKTDVTSVEGTLRAEISQSAAELETKMQEEYTAKSETVTIKADLESQIKQNAEQISSTVGKVETLETDTEQIKGEVLGAQTKADEAIVKAQEAQDAADQAQLDADEAKQLADQAQLAVDDAELALQAAQTELDTAKANLTEVTGRVDATEEEIDAARAEVVAAQQAVDQAQQDVLVAQAAAEEAKTAADEAMDTAIVAKQAAEQAQADLEELTSRVVTAETQISQNAEQIELRATKTEVYETLNDYLTEEETRALLSIESDSIKSTVSSTYATKQEVVDVDTKVDEVQSDIDNLEIGSRNMCLGTSSEWTEVSVDQWFATIMRFNMAELCEKYGLVDGDILTYSLYLKTNSGKTLAARWQKYNDSTDRIGETSEDTIIMSSGRSCVHPVIDTNYEYLDLMINNVEQTITDTTTEYYRCLQLEKGTVVTDWHPSEEDMATGEEVDSVQDNLNETAGKVDDLDGKVMEAKTEIEQLADAISTLVTDENGNSLMTQTSTGWTFNISGIQENVANNGDAITKLQELINTLSAATGGLEDAVGNLQETSEYIWLTTYEDEPCLALGESDTTNGLFITNTRIIFIKEGGSPTYITKDGMYTDKLEIGTELRHKDYVWAIRSNGNYGLSWKQIELTGIQVIYVGEESVAIGTVLTDLTGVVVRGMYSNDTVRNITSGYTLSGEIVQGENVITVTYEGFTGTFIVEGKVAGIVLGEATKCTISMQDTPGVSNSTSVRYSDAVKVEEGTVVLDGSTSFTLTESTPTDADEVYGRVYGKYVQVGNNIYYIDPSATWSRSKAAGSLFDYYYLTYEPAYLVSFVE